MIDRLPIESKFQVDPLKEFYPLISLFQLSVYLTTLHQINAKVNHVAENLQEHSLRVLEY